MLYKMRVVGAVGWNFSSKTPPTPPSSSSSSFFSFTPPHELAWNLFDYIIHEHLKWKGVSKTEGHD